MHRRTALIVTPYGQDNYGNRLQNNAIVELLRQSGVNSTTLILRRKPMLVGNVKEMLSTLADRLNMRGELSKKRKAFRHFDRDLKFARVWSYASLSRRAEKSDYIVVGSDQIWNPDHINFDGAEYGSFAPPQKVVPVSASFGVSEVSAPTGSLIKKHLGSVPHISVRESAGAELVRKYANREATVLKEPTLALSAEYWRGRADSSMKPDVPYLFVYVLGTNAAELLACAESYAAQRGMTVVQLEGRKVAGALAAGPQHFLGLIEGASAVVTDSFHAVIFSQLFGVDTYLVPRAGGSTMHSRFDTLFELLSLEVDEKRALFQGVNLVVNRSADLSASLDLERNRFQDFLARALK